MPFFTTPTDNISIFYTTNGSSSAPPILLIHGWCCDSHDWSWQIPFLSQTYHVIAMDLRGHGRSSAPESVEYSPKGFIVDAASLLRHLGFNQNVIIIGHSMGGVTASAFAVLEPGLVKAIVLVDPPYWRANEFADAVLPQIRGHPAIEDWCIEPYSALIAPNTPEWMKMWYIRRLLGTPRHVISKCLEGLLAEGKLGREEVCRKFVEGRKCPRYVVYIEEDTAEKEKSLGMGTLDEVVLMKGVGHWPHQAKSEEFNSMLGKWLNRLEEN
ncbi:alpha/beta-hydrolase [Zopfia rhizophila CBS 207.26]|uniref:Alpha/beta-hydrolase n=1 Tax=Zopfia rhizophila CBS 207.26 TaxID=1314779 RepID=A0A6A6DDR0_9PEZI|nr:alpha/beta-hydrolase [Zopfia rhizophila CBS 207.26]